MLVYEQCFALLPMDVFFSVKERAVEVGGSATFLTEFGICEPNATLTNSTGKDDYVLCVNAPCQIL